MQTWYDPTYGWVTRDASGQLRQATNAESLLAVSNGYQAPAGTASPDLAITAENAKIFGQAGGGQSSGKTYPVATGPGHWQQGGGGGAPVWVPDPAPTSGGTGPPPPPPATGWGDTPNQTSYGWGTGWHGSTAGAASPFADLTGVQQAYYQQHPDQANSLLRQWLAPQANSAYAQYINQRMPDLYNQFAAASTQKGNEGLQYTDWLKNNFGQLSDQFAGQSATQRGENPLSFGGGFAGRKAFF